MKRYSLILAGFLITAGILIGGNVFALVDDFDSYDDGILNNQGGWSMPADFEENVLVGSEYAKTGKGVGQIASGSNWITISKTFTAGSSDYIQSVYVDPSELGSGTFQIRIYDAEFNGYTAQFNSGYLTISELPDMPAIAYNENDWNLVEWEFTGLALRFRVNGGDWSEAVDWSWGDISKYQLALNGGTAVYYDNFDETEIETEPEPGSVFGITGASTSVAGIFTYVGDAFGGLSPIVALLIGLPLGFWFITKVIDIVNKKRKE